MDKVLVMGTFDLTHAGHFDLFKCAKKLGDHLTVGVGHDKLNRVFKGEGRPIYGINERILIIEANKHVDAVFVYGADCPDTFSKMEVIAYNTEVQLELLKQVQPTFFAQGIDNADPILESHLEKIGIQRVYLPRLSQEISTSHYIQKIKNFP